MQDTIVVTSMAVIIAGSAWIGFGRRAAANTPTPPALVVVDNTNVPPVPPLTNPPALPKPQPLVLVQATTPALPTAPPSETSLKRLLELFSNTDAASQQRIVNAVATARAGRYAQTREFLQAVKATGRWTPQQVDAIDAVLGQLPAAQ